MCVHPMLLIYPSPTLTFITFHQFFCKSNYFHYSFSSSIYGQMPPKIYHSFPLSIFSCGKLIQSQRFSLPIHSVNTIECLLYSCAVLGNGFTSMSKAMFLNSRSLEVSWGKDRKNKNKNKNRHRQDSESSRGDTGIPES